MAFVAKTFDNQQELVDYLNDLAMSKPLQARTYGLHALTLIINDGVGDRITTFSDSGEVGLTAKEIVDQIRLAHANMVNVGLKNYGHMSPPQPKLAVNLAGYTVDKDGTANVLLGFDNVADTVVGANSVALADIASISPAESNRFTVIHQ